MGSLRVEKNETSKNNLKNKKPKLVRVDQKVFKIQDSHFLCTFFPVISLHFPQFPIYPGAWPVGGIRKIGHSPELQE